MKVRRITEQARLCVLLIRAFRVSLFYRATATSITLIKLPTHALRAETMAGPFRRPRRNCHMAEHFK